MNRRIGELIRIGHRGPGEDVDGIGSEKVSPVIYWPSLDSRETGGSGKFDNLAKGIFRKSTGEFSVSRPGGVPESLVGARFPAAIRNRDSPRCSGPLPVTVSMGLMWGIVRLVTAVGYDSGSHDYPCGHPV